MNYKLKIGDECYWCIYDTDRIEFCMLDYERDVNKSWSSLDRIEELTSYYRITKKQTIISKLGRVIFYDS